MAEAHLRTMDGVGEFSLQVVRTIARSFFEALFEFLFRLIATPICRAVGYVYAGILRNVRQFVRCDIFAVPLATIVLMTAAASAVFFSVKALQWVLL